jgi:hypothetical protein
LEIWNQAGPVGEPLEDPTGERVDLRAAALFIADVCAQAKADFAALKALRGER